ncbi:MAG: DUF4294 domain-containing protein [Chitinophagaceae bacterium]|nr:DUF4294 domain-containing protein [Chitinophagaceae bacterium]
MFCCAQLIFAQQNVSSIQNESLEPIDEEKIPKRKRGIYDTILVNAIIENGLKVPFVYTRPVFIYAKAPQWLVEQRRNSSRQKAERDRLRYYVYKVYPYAVATSFVIHDIDSALLKIRSKDAKKFYKSRKEKELFGKYKNEIENLTINEGQVLVKLIARQTGKSCYEIIREMKSGFNARIWQTVAILFDNNLKANYEPQAKDSLIEKFVLEIESKGRFERVH